MFWTTLITSCPLNFFMNKRAGNTDKSTSQQQFPIFSPELSKMKRGVELLSRETRRIDFKVASSLAVYTFVSDFHSIQLRDFFIHILRWASWNIPCRIDRNHSPNFNKLQLLTLVTKSVPNRSWCTVYIQHDLRSLNLFSNSWWLVLFELLASLTPWESPLNSSDLKYVLTENKQAWPECHIINCLLT